MKKLYKIFIKVLKGVKWKILHVIRDPRILFVNLQAFGSPTYTEDGLVPNQWTLAKSNAPSVIFSSENFETFCVDCTSSSGSRHTNITAEIPIVLEGLKAVTVIFSCLVVDVAKGWPKLTLVANFKTQNGSIRSDKETIRTTKTVGNVSQHRVVFPVLEEDHNVQLAFYIPKDSFVEFQFSDIRIEESSGHCS